MILPNPKDAIHKAWLYRLLKAFYSDHLISKHLYFKGGTCAAMLCYLDRFSIDLDFDFIGEKDQIDEVQVAIEKIFNLAGTPRL
jgi:predicted nucleotidyltransferase component of viral defense system